MHEQAVMRDVMAKIEEVSRAEEGARVSAVHVRLGSLSHFTPEHFAEHFADASRGTCAEGATVFATVDSELGLESAAGVVLESLEIDAGPPAEAS